MIQQFVGSVVGGPVVGGRLTSRSVACGFNKIQKKKSMFGAMISPLIKVCFVILILIFSMLVINMKHF